MDQADEERRQNLYKVCKSLRTTNPPISRLMYVAKLDTGDHSHAKKNFEKLMKEWIGQYEGKHITGLMLIIANFHWHLLEVDDSAVIFYMLEDLKRQKDEEDSIYANISVLAVTEENPSRIFPEWAARTIPISSSGGAAEDEESTTPDFEESWRLYEKMLEVSKRVSSTMGGSSNPNALTQALKSQAIDILPNPDELAHFTTPKFPTIDEYLEMYDGQMEVVLEGELVWPIGAPLTY